MVYSIQHLNIVPVLVVENSHAPLLSLAAHGTREINFALLLLAAHDINFALVVVHGTLLHVTLILHYFGWYTCVRALHLVAVHSIRLFVTSILHYFLVLIVVGRFEFRKIIRYSRSTINACFLISHEWCVPPWI